jgi:hypothetical protein
MVTCSGGSNYHYLATIATIGATAGAITVIGKTMDTTGAPVGIDGIAWTPPEIIGRSGFRTFHWGAGFLALLAAVLPLVLILKVRLRNTATRLAK